MEHPSPRPRKRGREVRQHRDHAVQGTRKLRLHGKETLTGREEMPPESDVAGAKDKADMLIRSAVLLDTSLARYRQPHGPP